MGWSELVEAFEDVAGGEAVGDGDAGGAEGGDGDAVDRHVEGGGEAWEGVGVRDGADGVLVRRWIAARLRPERSARSL